jgi:guanylate kinase
MVKSTDSTGSSSSHPLLIILSGPSGVGKDSVLNQLKVSNSNLRFITTLTTRKRRPQEKDGVDYRFVSRDEFQQLLDKGELLESANVYGNWYGVPKQPIRDAFKEGKDIIVKVDVQGAATIKKIVPDAVFIFLLPPEIEELGNRLRQRYTETPSEMATRLETACKEMENVICFDYSVVNYCDELNTAVSEIKAIIAAEKCRVNPREISLP